MLLNAIVEFEYIVKEQSSLCSLLGYSDVQTKIIHSEEMDLSFAHDFSLFTT